MDIARGKQAHGDRYYTEITEHGSLKWGCTGKTQEEADSNLRLRLQRKMQELDTVLLALGSSTSPVLTPCTGQGGASGAGQVDGEVSE